MKLLIFTILIYIAIFFSACQNIANYNPDIAYASSGESNYPNEFVLINDKPCLDSEGVYGLCSYRVKKNDLRIKLQPKQYSYTLDHRCAGIDELGNIQYFMKFSKTILPSTEENFTLLWIDMKPFIKVNCLGRIIKDIDYQEVDKKTMMFNDKPITSFWEINLRIVAENYKDPEIIYTVPYLGKKYLVLGEYAKYATIRIKNKYYKLTKQVVFEYKNEPNFAMYETENMRYSYYGKY